MNWIFQPSDPMGGAAGEAYANTLTSAGMPPEHVLAREAIQNSVDAGIPDSKVRVVFRATTVKNTEKKTFVEAAGLTDIAARATTLALGPNQLGSLSKAAAALPLLYVEDYNAVGLSGGPHDKSSNFFRLLLSLGDRSKARMGKGSGGSYGFGKSVYSSSSAIQTIFAYTRFKKENGEESTRVFGCGYYASHKHNAKDFSGRAWLGALQDNDGEGRTVVDPLVDGPADELAQKLGFTPRAPGQFGTSILIVDSSVDPAAIQRGVENWWWPRLIANKLDVEITTPTGESLLPRPRKREELQPFIEAFDIARAVAAPKSGSQELFKPNAEQGVALGSCGFVIAPIDAMGNPSVGAEKSNRIALIRGPLMVVAYQHIAEMSPVIVGAYVAPEDEEIDLVLKASEPPAHDRWDPDSNNLREADGKKRKLVTALLSRLKAGMRRFHQRAAPPPPLKARRLTLLENALGNYFKPQGFGNSGKPEAGTSPLHLEFTQQPHVLATNDGRLQLKCSFNVTLDSNSVDQEVDLRLDLACAVLENENEEGDHLALKVIVSGVSATCENTIPPRYFFKLVKGEKAKFTVTSEPYDPTWTVRLRPDIDRVEEQQ